jgi:hypothetical protein
MSWAAVIGAAGSIGGALISKNGSKQSGNLTTTHALDPRFDSMFFGANGQDGLLGQYQTLMNKPQDSRLQDFGNANLSYLSGQGGVNLGHMTQAADKLLNPMQVQAPGVAPPAWAQGSMVQAPGQNGIDLTGAYKDMVYGAPGSNSFLTGAIQKGINQSSNAFGNMVTDAKQATQDVLGGIRSNAVLAGQYGGSRQGIAEGKAIDSMNTNLARATSQFGQNNTDAAVAAQAGAYDSDRNRALAAMSGLGAQQYATAFKNADTRNAAEFMNVANHNQINENYANRAQQANLANQQASMNGAVQGAGLLGGINSGAYTAGQNMDNYALGRAQAFNGLMTPWLGATGSSTQPLYENKAGNMLGGAMMGGQLAGGLFGGGGSGNTGSLFDLFGKNSSFSGGGYF